MRWVIKNMRSVSQEQCYNEAAISYELIWAQLEKFSIVVRWDATLALVGYLCSWGFVNSLNSVFRALEIHFSGFTQHYSLSQWFCCFSRCQYHSLFYWWSKVSLEKHYLFAHIGMFVLAPSSHVLWRGVIQKLEVFAWREKQTWILKSFTSFPVRSRQDKLISVPEVCQINRLGG